MKLILVCVAIAAFLIAALMFAGTITSNDGPVWQAAGLVALASSFLPWPD